ncbi:MAG: hypothetical protein HY618_07770 [Candidatus Tectomicrobia bacterium]|uniref:Uncharacterized protein n=1 Tax=Tectimicrobiota bacterium TaxID=2528274 RepID=A0A932ZUG3_UNCTE|nr:hypothetical protein [Candidatus Tectomicrobia bacterium]
MQKVADIQFPMPTPTDSGVFDVVEKGRKSGCPFCQVRFRTPPNVGERVLFLSDHHIGKTATVVPSPPNFPIPDEFLVQMDGAPVGHSMRVSLDRELVSSEIDITVPDWMPPIPSRDAEEADRGIIHFCGTSSWGGKPKPDWQAFMSLTRFVWQKRLPICRRELAAMLMAHGVPREHTATLARFFDYGRRLLIAVAGRKPVKKKRKRTWTYPE